MENEFRHGWRVVFAGLWGNALGVGAILFYSVSSLIGPLEAEFGWNRAEIGFAVSCLTIGWILSMPLIGRLCDRYGARRVILPSIPLLSLCLASLSLIQNQLWMLYLGFFASAILGGGTLGITYINAVSGWFDRNRGLAYGITLAGTGISAYMLPLVLYEVISGYGWRSAWLLLAALVLLQFPIAWWGVRSRSDTAMPASQSTTKATAGVSFREAIRSQQFWLLSLAFLTIALMAGLLVNLIPLLVESGVSKGRAAVLASYIGIGLLFARISIGFMVDRLPSRFVAIFAFMIAAAGCQILLSDNLDYAGLGAFALGFTSGAELDLLAFMTSRYFGLRNHGSIYGMSLSLFYVGAMVAPVLVGFLYEYHGSYELSLQVIIVCCFVASALILAVGPCPNTKWVTSTETT